MTQKYAPNTTKFNFLHANSGFYFENRTYFRQSRILVYKKGFVTLKESDEKSKRQYTSLEF